MRQMTEEQFYTVLREQRGQYAVTAKGNIRRNEDNACPICGVLQREVRPAPERSLLAYTGAANKLGLPDQLAIDIAKAPTAKRPPRTVSSCW
jgi:hypothetical protein